jgi:arginase
MRVALIPVPYDLGRADEGLGAGVPLLAATLDAHAKASHDIGVVEGDARGALREGLAAVPQEHVAHVGGRDLDRAQDERLERSAILRVRPSEPVERALDELAARVASVFVHVDLDVLDPSVGVANRYAAGGGLSLEDVERVVDAVGRRFAIRAAALTAYEPGCDPERRIPAAARAIFEQIVAVRDPLPA